MDVHSFSPIENLPQEILYKICSHIDYPSLKNLKATNRFFSHIVKQYRIEAKVLDFSPYPLTTFFQIKEAFYDPEYKPRLTKLILRGCKNITDKNLLQLSSTFSSIEKLDIIDCCKLTRSGLIELSRLTCLNSLKLGYKNLKTIIHNHQSIEYDLRSLVSIRSLSHLTIKRVHNKSIPTKNLLEAIGNLKNLRKLNLTNNVAFVPNQISLAYLPKLSSLEVLILKKNCIEVDVNSCSISLAQILPNLKSISLAGCQLTANLEPIIVQTIQNRYVEMNDRRQKFLNNLIQLPKLESLNLTGWHLCLNNISVLSQSGSLKSLNLSRCLQDGFPKIWSEKEINAIKNLMNLKSLDISCTKIKYEALSILCDLKELTYLNLEKCQGFKFSKYGSPQHEYEHHAASIADLKNGRTTLKSLLEGIRINKKIQQQVEGYLSNLHLSLRNVPEGGDCFFHSFIGSYNELKSKNLLSIQALEKSEDKIQLLRDKISKAIEQVNPHRAAIVKTKNAWVIANGEGSELAIELNIPIRVITVEKDYNELLGIRDELYFNPTSNFRNGRVLKNGQIFQKQKSIYFIFVSLI